MIDTKNEHPDTYRFLMDCEDWYGCEIESITTIGVRYESIQDVWIRHKSLNVAAGAVCSHILKKKVREKWQRRIKFSHQVFGFEFEKKEFNRARAMSMNHKEVKPIFPLLMMGYTKEKCIEIIQDAGIEVPVTYRLGFRNNNCFSTGCVQGGIGYWKKMKVDFPDKFDAMAEMEHRLTNEKGEPVTMLKDQSSESVRSGNNLVFLKTHPDYPNMKTIDQMRGREIEPLFECSGFCGTNDLIERNPTENEINFTGQVDLF
jgi:hypothetical protein